MIHRAIAASTALTIAGACLSGAIAQDGQAGPSLPAVYQYEVPYPKTDGPAAVVTVRHNAGGLSIAHVHAADASTPLLSGDPEDFALSSSQMFLAGPATGGRAASPEPIAGGVLVNEGPPAFETGQRYADGEAYDPETDDPAPSWMVEGLVTSFSDGDDDKTIAGLEADHRQLMVSYNLTRYGRDGEVREQRTVHDTRDFWFTDALPYSPLQTIPNIYDPAHFTPSGLELLDEAIQADVAGEMAALGAVVAQEGKGPAGMSGKSRLSSIEETDAYLPEQLAAIPVIPGEEADLLLGTLFVTEMLKQEDRIPEGGSLNLSLGEAASAETGRAAWREMPNGDFGIALRPAGGAAEGTVLLLMRPVNGVPDAGTHEAAIARGPNELADLDEAALAAHAEKFQAMGMVRHKGQDYVVKGFKSGSVTIDEAGEETITGSLEATVKLLAIDGSGEAGLFDITGDFEAVKGLGARFQSPVAMAMRRR